MKTSIIIQARLSSKRLPGKVLLKIMNKTILEYVIERAAKSSYVKDLIVATTDKKEDQQIVELSRRLKVAVYCGSEEDVLDRYYKAAKLFNSDHIVRITADCPLIDPCVIDDVIKHYLASDADYCANTLEETYPDGEDVEVFSFSVLSEAWQNAKLLSEREHVTPYIKKCPDKFKLVNLKNKIDLSAQRWTLDEKEDFIFLKAVLEFLYPVNPNFNMDDILEFLAKNPKLADTNNTIIKNEGYLESLKKDRSIRP